MGKADEPPLKARLIPSTSNALTCTPQTGHSISMYLGGPTTFFDANLCPFAGWDTWHHYIITSCRGHLLLTWGLLTLVPYESQLSSLNIRESILGTCHGACLLKSPTAQTSISGSDASLRHAPRASPQASSSPRTHISFHHRSFFQMWIWERRQKRQLWCGKWSPWNWIGGPLTFPKSFYRSRYLWWVIGTDNYTRRVWRLAPFKYLSSKKTNKWMPSICVFFAVEYVHKLYHIRVCRPEVNQEAEEAECFRLPQSPSRTWELGTS